MRIFKSLILVILIIIMNWPGHTSAQTSCTIIKSNCPPNDLIPACANAVVNGVFGAYVNWSQPAFSLSCPGGGTSGYEFVMSYNLNESLSGNECWVYNKVQRTATGDGRLNLWQSTGSGNPSFTTPTFFFPTPPTNCVMSVTNDSKNNFTVNVYLIFPDGTKSGINSSFLVSGSKDYPFTVTTPEAGAYRLFIEFVGNGSNKDFVDQLSINAPLFGTACSGDINFSITSNHTPGEFFPVGTTRVTYTAVCNSCVPIVSETCSFDVVVNGVTATATKTDATCGLDNGTITINATSSNSSPTLQYSVNNTGWVNFTSPVTITGLSQGIKTVDVRDYFSNNSSYCHLLAPISLTINRINDNIPPVVNCPPSLILNGCNTNSVTELNSGFVFSPVQQTISEGQLTAIGGSVSDNCGISSIKYQDLLSGICPLIVTRVFLATDTNGNTASCSQSITILDNTPPDYTVINQEYCVQNIVDVSFHNSTIPDWFVFKSGSTDLDLKNLFDNCTPNPDLKLAWQIAFADGTYLSGNGQPSTFGSDIVFKGSANNSVNHQITYWVTDNCGNRTTKICTVTIHPRSELDTN